LAPTVITINQNQNDLRQSVSVRSTVSDITGNDNHSYYIKKKVGDDQNHLVKLASEISGNNLNWILTLEAENGLWDMYRRHPVKNRNGTTDWACGLNSAYHKGMIDKIKNHAVTEEEILRYCYSVYQQRPTAFYGYRVRLKYKSKFYLSKQS